MNILAIELSPSSGGGAGKSFFDVCHGLNKRGHSITIACRTGGDLLEGYQKFCMHTQNFNSQKRANFPFYLRKLLALQQIVTNIREIPNRKYDVAYSNYYYEHPFDVMIALCKKIPLVRHIRIPPPDGSLNLSSNMVKRFITVSNQTKFDWIKKGMQGEKIDIVYNGIDTGVFRPSENSLENNLQFNASEGVRTISYVGRLEYGKGIEILIKAFALVLRRGISARLLIAGKSYVYSSVENRNNYQSTLEQLVIDLKIKKNIKFLGHIANVIPIYQISDVTVLPSFQFHEPFGRSIVESMACGVPVVASRLGGIPEIMTGEFQSWLFDPGNADNLADALQRIINWKVEDPYLGERCRKHVVDNFHLEKTIDGVERVLREVSKRC